MVEWEDSSDCRGWLMLLVLQTVSHRNWTKVSFVLGKAVTAWSGLSFWGKACKHHCTLLHTYTHAHTRQQQQQQQHKEKDKPHTYDVDIWGKHLWCLHHNPRTGLMNRTTHTHTHTHMHIYTHKHHTQHEPSCPAVGPIHRHPSHGRPPRLALSLARCSAAGLEDLTQCVELLLKNNQSQPATTPYFFSFLCTLTTFGIWVLQDYFLWICMWFFFLFVVVVCVFFLCKRPIYYC